MFERITVTDATLDEYYAARSALVFHWELKHKMRDVESFEFLESLPDVSFHLRELRYQDCDKIVRARLCHVCSHMCLTACGRTCNIHYTDVGCRSAYYTYPNSVLQLRYSSNLTSSSLTLYNSARVG